MKRMRGYIIHLGALSFVNDKEDNTILSSYKNVVYGRGVKFDSKHYEEADSMHRYDLLNMHKMKRNYIAITANKRDCVGNCDDVDAIPTICKGRNHRHILPDVRRLFQS